MTSLLTQDDIKWIDENVFENAAEEIDGLYVTEEDIKAEISVMRTLSGKIPKLKGFIFRRNLDPIAIFDFKGFYNGQHKACFDIKVRSIQPDQFDTYFISEEKYYHLLDENRNFHFIAYAFPSGLIRVFNLNTCTLIKKSISFYHKRAKKKVTDSVYEVLASQVAFEINALDK